MKNNSRTCFTKKYFNNFFFNKFTVDLQYLNDLLTISFKTDYILLRQKTSCLFICYT